MIRSIKVVGRVSLFIAEENSKNPTAPIVIAFMSTAFFRLEACSRQCTGNIIYYI